MGSCGSFLKWGIPELPGLKNSSPRHSWRLDDDWGTSRKPPYLGYRKNSLNYTKTHIWWWNPPIIPTRWCPPVISWFISPLTIDISPINHSHWSYVHKLSYRTGAPPCIKTSENCDSHRLSAQRSQVIPGGGSECAQLSKRFLKAKPPKPGRSGSIPSSHPWALYEYPAW